MHSFHFQRDVVLHWFDSNFQARCVETHIAAIQREHSRSASLRQTARSTDLNTMSAEVGPVVVPVRTQPKTAVCQDDAAGAGSAVYRVEHNQASLKFFGRSAVRENDISSHRV